MRVPEIISYRHSILDNQNCAAIWIDGTENRTIVTSRHFDEGIHTLHRPHPTLWSTSKNEGTTSNQQERWLGSYSLFDDNALSIALNGHLAARSENTHNQREGSCNASDSNYNLGGWRCGHHFKLYCGMNVDSVCGRNSWYVLFFSPSWRRRGVATAYGRGSHMGGKFSKNSA